MSDIEKQRMLELENFMTPNFHSGHPPSLDLVFHHHTVVLEVSQERLHSYASLMILEVTIKSKLQLDL